MDNDTRLQLQLPGPRGRASSWARLRTCFLGAAIACGAALLAFGCTGAGDPSGVCADGCFVGNVCFPDGAPDPENPCAACDHLASGTAFSPNDGGSCDDGRFCTEHDVCSAGICTGSTRDCDDGIACNGAETCSNPMGACRAGTPICASDQLCDATTGDCIATCPGCAIDGTCYGDGQVNPLAPCELCAVPVSRVAWSDADGRLCDDDDFCSTHDVCVLGVCVGGEARVCDDGTACNGVESCDEEANACVGGATVCGPDAVCDVALDECVPACTGCVIDGVCYGAGQTNPSNSCEICAVGTSRTAFSANDGARCDDGSFCTVQDVCAAGLCAGAPSNFCDDSVACNGEETCNELADRCDLGVTTCTGGLVCDPTTDECVLECVGGTTMCDGSCVNTASDPAHCGWCSNQCAPGEACVSGTCNELVSRTFTTCGATGFAGPSNARCATAYAGTPLDGEVIVTAGIQAWLVPVSGTYRVEAFGAQGATASSGTVGGRGARVRGDFALAVGQELRIIVGQMGTADGTSGGGGGGSFVVDAATRLPLLVAGGGGGTRWHLSQNGCGGRVSELGGAGSGSSATSACDAKTSGVTFGGVVSLAAYGSGGAGFLGNGAADAPSGGGVSYSFVNGGNGGNCTAYGGFGGGGSGNGSAGGGGGGGYSGGDGGGLGGGGGSYNGGANQDSAAGAQSGAGLVTVQRI